MELATMSCDATSGFTELHRDRGSRVYGERDELKKRGRSAARSGAEEVVEGHFNTQRVSDEQYTSSARPTDRPRASFELHPRKLDRHHAGAQKTPATCQCKGMPNCHGRAASSARPALSHVRMPRRKVAASTNGDRMSNPDTNTSRPPSGRVFAARYSLQSVLPSPTIT